MSNHNLMIEIGRMIKIHKFTLNWQCRTFHFTELTWRSNAQALLFFSAILLTFWSRLGFKYNNIQLSLERNRTEVLNVIITVKLRIKRKIKRFNTKRKKFKKLGLPWLFMMVVTGISLDFIFPSRALLILLRCSL